MACHHGSVLKPHVSGQLVLRRPQASGVVTLVTWQRDTKTNIAKTCNEFQCSTQVLLQQQLGQKDPAGVPVVMETPASGKQDVVAKGDALLAPVLQRHLEKLQKDLVAEGEAVTAR